MCQCGSRTPATPNAAPGSLTPAVGAFIPCPGAQSAVLVVDEIGIPLRNTAITVRIGAAAPANTSTDANGMICFSQPPGLTGQIELAETHEAGTGDSTATASGQHFRAGGTGP